MSQKNKGRLMPTRSTMYHVPATVERRGAKRSRCDSRKVVCIGYQMDRSNVELAALNPGEPLNVWLQTVGNLPRCGFPKGCITMRSHGAACCCSALTSA